MALQAADLLMLSRAGTLLKETFATLAAYVLGNPVTTGVLYSTQVAPTTGLSAAATLTIAQLLTQIVQTGGTAFTLTLPSGANTDAGILAGALPVNGSFEWSMISGSSGIVTLADEDKATPVADLVRALLS